MVAWWEILGRMLLAAVLGGVLGWEREARGKPAGLRTLALVSLAAAVFILAGEQAALSLGEPVDAMRGMTGVVQGIGFLGAGVILQARGEVRWLTTAAALWMAAAVGLATGLGLYFIAVAGGLLAFAILRWLVVVEERWIRPSRNVPKAEGDTLSKEKH